MREPAHDTADLLCRLATAVDRHCADVLKPLGLSLSDYAVLGGLGAGAAESQNRLAAASGVHPTSLVAMLDRLERCGFVRRCASASDRRRNMIRATEKGIDALHHARRVSTHVVDARLALLNPGERTQLHDLLVRVA